VDERRFARARELHLVEAREDLHEGARVVEGAVRFAGVDPPLPGEVLERLALGDKLAREWQRVVEAEPLERSACESLEDAEVEAVAVVRDHDVVAAELAKSWPDVGEGWRRRDHLVRDAMRAR